MKKRLRFELNGYIQGVGFRPFVYKEAFKLNLCGFVANSSDGVLIEVEGKKEAILEFEKQLTTSLPPLARIESVKKTFITPLDDKDFRIEKSIQKDKKSCLILPDFAPCEDCLKEFYDPKNRRYLYPFINCTNCGPRHSIIKNIPYDRFYTSMNEFKMCKECKSEYENPLDRRYHAEPISCPNCGPKIEFLSKSNQNKTNFKNAANIIKQGGIIALKGVGGFHMICDALNFNAIKKLRLAKNRPTKPFALMCKDLQMAKKYTHISDVEATFLNSLQRPIVLVEKKDNQFDLIASNTQKLGIFLPPSPLHEKLFMHLDRPIVATSANLKNEPIIKDKDVLLSSFGAFFDLIIDHNRKIINSNDDSLIQVVDKSANFLRLSRGFAPLNLKINSPHTFLALGAMNKNAIGFLSNNKITISPYLGTSDSVEGFYLFKKTIENFKKIYDLDFEKVICDKHPNYPSSKFAKSLNLPVLQVQHHHAHILSAIFDNDLDLKKEYLGIVWDGTGYGDDGTIWGGEFLKVQGALCERVAHIKPFKLLGGEGSIKNIDRIAFSILQGIKCEKNINFENSKLLLKMYEKNINSLFCSSMGRIFDAVCFLATGLKNVTYDGESGLFLESCFDEKITQSYDIKIDKNIIDFDAMFLEILKDKHYQNHSALIATKFINSLADLIIKIGSIYNLPTILSGGCFQNATLLKILKNKNTHLDIFYPKNLTPNDGSICVGQLIYGILK